MSWSLKRGITARLCWLSNANENYFAIGKKFQFLALSLSLSSLTVKLFNANKFRLTERTLWHFNCQVKQYARIEIFRENYSFNSQGVVCRQILENKHLNLEKFWFSFWKFVILPQNWGEMCLSQQNCEICKKCSNSIVKSTFQVNCITFMNFWFFCFCRGYHANRNFV